VAVATFFLIFAVNFNANPKMKTIFIYPLLAVAAIAMSGCSAFKNVNTGRVVQAGVTALTAASITDAQVAEMSRQSMVLTDSENTIAAANSPYAKRLADLTRGLGNYGGLSLNYKVYMTDQVNAFASGDGSIRVFSGLMDVMDDDQLMAIVGHEIGHVKNEDSKDAIKNAYLYAAGREAVGAVGGTLGTLSDGVLGQIAETYLNARYSQKQEHAADDYGVDFTVAAGRDPYSMMRSMQKLQQLSGGGTSVTPGLMQAFSSHPDTAERERRMREKANAYLKK
jgi:putative metalloprotease